MDTKTEIKQEVSVSNIASQNETELFSKDLTVMMNNNATIWIGECAMNTKTEVKAEPFPDLCSQKDFANSDFATWNNDCKIDTITQIKQEAPFSYFSQNEREFDCEDPVMKVEQCSNDYEKDNKAEIKEELWWMEKTSTEATSLCGEIKDGGKKNFSHAELSRLYAAEVYDDSTGKSALFSDEDINFTARKDSPECEKTTSSKSYESDIVETFSTEQPDKCNGGDIYSLIPCSKQTYFVQENNSHAHENCTYKSTLISHNLSDKCRKMHKCDTCGKSFSRLSRLKRHKLIHERKKLCKCGICEKSFTSMLDLKKHKFIHKGEKLYKCEICEKSFTQLSHLKLHSFIHEGEKPHKCSNCDKSFTQLSHLKRHYLIHEGKKPYKCEICDKVFAQLSHLKVHNWVHEGKKPYKCETCEKSFSRSSHLKRHKFIHEGKKPYKCDICEKNFSQLSNLERHNLTHESKMP